MELRHQFIDAWLARKDTVTALCQEFGISRKTGNKWIDRFYEGGRPGLLDRSRRPLTIPNQVGEDIKARIINLRKKFRFWGPKKLLAWLENHEPQTKWPSQSTIHVILKASGLIDEKRRRSRTPHSLFL